LAQVEQSCQLFGLYFYFLRLKKIAAKLLPFLFKKISSFQGKIFLVRLEQDAK
jgi:hypothetical protein